MRKFGIFSACHTPQRVFVQAQLGHCAVFLQEAHRSENTAFCHCRIARFSCGAAQGGRFAEGARMLVWNKAKINDSALLLPYNTDDRVKISNARVKHARKVFVMRELTRLLAGDVVEQRK